LNSNQETFNSRGIITFAGGESITGLGTVPRTHLEIQSPGIPLGLPVNETRKCEDSKGTQLFDD
jgi:hypothetical protein